MNTLLSSYTLPWPTDWHAVFGHPAGSAPRPLIVEIGFGYGQMLRYLHTHHPEADIIGLEIDNFSLVKAENFIRRDDLRNVRVIHSRAETALHHLFTPASLSQVHINFPDPWFKDRHAGRRLMQRDTLDAIVSRLTLDGKLFLATDILAYAEMSAALLAETPGLLNTLAAPWVNAYAARATTKYERRAREQGRDCYYFAYQRSTHPAPLIPVIEELPMPNLVLHCPLTLDDIQTRYDLDTHPTFSGAAEAHINFLHLYRGREALLFEVFINEPTIDQRLAIILGQRENAPGEYVLKLSVLGNPRPTAGVHEAVGLLGDWLLGLHPDGRILHDKLRRG